MSTIHRVQVLNYSLEILHVLHSLAEPNSIFQRGKSLFVSMKNKKKQRNLGLNLVPVGLDFSVHGCYENIKLLSLSGTCEKQMQLRLIHDDNFRTSRSF